MGINAIKNIGVISQNDYYPFGMLLPNRNGTVSGGEYRYAFNGMEGDPEWQGAGNSYDFGAQMYNPRTGRWNSVDDKEGIYYSFTPYCFAGNNPILFIDPDGNAIEIYGSRKYIKSVIAEMQKLTDAKLSYDAKTHTVNYIMPKKIAVPKIAGNSLITSLIDCENTVKVMDTPTILSYFYEHGAPEEAIKDILKGGNQTFREADDGGIHRITSVPSNAQFIGDNSVVHFSSYLDVEFEATLFDFTREAAPKSIVLGHELIHAWYILFGLVLEGDNMADMGRLDWDQAETPGLIVPTTAHASYHEWEVRSIENLLRAEQNLKARHLGYYDYNLVDELMEYSEDFIDPFTDEVMIKGTGLDYDSPEFWDNYLKESGAKANTDDLNKSNQRNNSRIAKYEKKATKAMEKAEKKVIRKEKRSFKRDWNKNRF